jgi:hypothetical protein
MHAMTPIELLDSTGLKAALGENAKFLPSKSDRATAQSLAAWRGDLTANQQYLARQLLLRAAKFRHSGPKDAGDIFNDADSAVSRTISTPPPAPSAPLAIDSEALEGIVKRILEPGLAQIAQQVDARSAMRQEAFNRSAARVIAEQCVPRVLEEMEKRKPREVLVRVTRDEVTRAASGKTHKMFEHLVRAASLRLANGYSPGIFLAGEAGSGKTTGAKMLAEVLGLSWHFNGAISFPHEMLGFIDAGGRYHRTPFREAYEFGGVYTFDEVDRSDPVALLGVNPHLANGIATFPDKQVTRHRDCIIVATANTWGHGADAQYSGATKLDAAFLSRFPVRISWDIDEVLEAEIVGAGAWLDMVRTARQRARSAGLKVMIDTRHALAGAGMLSAGYSLSECAEMTYLAGLKPDQKAMLRGQS